MAKAPERWHLTHDGHEHTVEISSTATAWQVHWTTNGTEVASKKTSESTVVLDGQKHGAVRLKLPSLMGPARQVTLFTTPSSKGKSWLRGKKKPTSEPATATNQARLGVGGTDFVPEEGSRAAQRETWIRDHPHLYALRRTVGAAAGVLVPVALVWLLHQIPWRPNVNLPSIPWEKLPSVPWPDISLPHVNLPDLPNLPNLPDLPDLPGWTQYLWPVLIAFGFAQAELRRRRQQDERRKAATDVPEAKEANGKTPGTSKVGKPEPGMAKPAMLIEEPAEEKDDKTTQSCRVESVRPKSGA
jgi:hypothetical protein